MQQNSGGDAALGREVLSESQDFWSHGSRPKSGSLATRPSEVGLFVAVAGCSHHAGCCYPCYSRHALVCLTATRWWAVYDGVRGGRNHMIVCCSCRCWWNVSYHCFSGHLKESASRASSLVPQGMRNIDMYKDTFPTFAWWKHMLPLTFLQTEMLE